MRPAPRGVAIIDKSYNPPTPPKPGEGKRGEDGYFGYLLRQAAGAYRRRMEAALADLGVTQPQYAVLTLLDAYPGLSNADLARVALLTPQTLNLIVAKLANSGMIAKRPHPVHRRIQSLELTEQGRALRAAARTRVRVLETTLAAGCSEDEQKLIRRWLAGVTAG